MTERALLFDSVEGDRIVGSAVFRDAFHGLHSDGVAAGVGDEEEITATNPVTADALITTGTCFVQGSPHHVDDDLPFDVLTSAPAHGTHPRIDRIVVRHDPTERTTEYLYLPGTAQAVPVPPEPTRNPGGTWDSPRYRVVVPANATQVYSTEGDAPSGQAYLVDERLLRAPGGDLVVPDLDARALWLPSAPAHTSVTVAGLGPNGIEYRWNGSAWVPASGQIIGIDEVVGGTPTELTVAIPSGLGFRRLELEWSVKSASGSPTLSLELNDDTTASNYLRQHASANDTALNAVRSSTRSIAAVHAGTTGHFSVGLATILDYARTDRHKIVMPRNVSRSSDADPLVMSWQGFRWTNTDDAVTKIKLTLSASSLIPGSYLLARGIV